ncbi:hypothetical protein PSTG_07201 [Puccinia striiformis f. sp. tritici PST-78]|uniref:Uncharacterized protein n=1 Tax=Puccinia striiformis f. sp. tritici PST-78 TaxID=1165861 RepID=A0A0L0VJP4_9BASI|nr:hypothetical protein PSTG_07201 [Puccinia striiformis f. sp. tritici PST-78]
MDFKKLAGAQKLLEDEQARRRRQKRRPKQTQTQRVKLPYLDQKAIELTKTDYDCKERKVPTSHPDGPRHARVYTLIGRGSSAPLRQQGTASRPAPNAKGILKRRPPPLATPALDTQAGPSRSDRTQPRAEPEAETSRLSRVAGLTLRRN